MASIFSIALKLNNNLRFQSFSTLVVSRCFIHASYALPSEEIHNNRSENAILYRIDAKSRVAYITLNRPTKLNAIDFRLPKLLRAAVERANEDDQVHAIILGGSGRAFCSGYDLELAAERPGPNPGFQKMPWDPTIDFKYEYSIQLILSKYSVFSFKYCSFDVNIL